jgi:thiol-disulfide isomerase/thioredoxin
MPLLSLLFVLQAGAPATPAPTPAPQAQQEQAKDPFLELAKEFTQAKSKWRLAERKLQTDEERAAHKAANPVHEYWPRVEALVAAGDARGLVWLAEAVADKLEDKQQVAARKGEYVAKLLGEHADAPWAATELVAMLARQRAWFDETWVRAKLDELAAKSKNKEVTASALYELSRRLHASNATEEDKARAKQLRERIASEFAGTRAGAELLAQQNARSVEVGGVAPDFSAVDGADVAFKLSDYRGKVVLLDFWGFWCGPCVASLPHIRELSARFADEPFAALGVNTDTDKQRFLEQVKARDVTWRNAFTGGKDNPISRLYRVSGYPTILVIDHEGVIKRRYLGAPKPRELERVLDELIAAAKSAKAPSEGDPKK